MGYIGQTPTAVPLDGDDLADGIISEAKLGADAVSLAKMKAGTDGNLISFDSSGNPAYVATGNDGQVLTSAGAGQPCAFEDASAGGAWNVIASTDVSSSTGSVTLTGLDATYDKYVITFTGMKGDNGSSYPQIRMGTSGGIDSGTNYQSHYGHANFDSSSVYGRNVGSNAAVRIGHTASSQANDVLSGVIYLGRPSNHTEYLPIYGHTVLTFINAGVTGGVITHNSLVGGCWVSTSAYTQVQYLYTGGNVTAGRMTAYGIAHA